MNQARFTPYLYIFYSFIFVLDIIGIYYQNQGFHYFIGICALIMMIISFPMTTRLFRILGCSFTIVGIGLLITTDTSLASIPNLLVSNISILTLIAMLPWMNSVVKAGRFDRVLHSLLQLNVHNLGQLYPRSTTTMLSLTAFLNVSAATIAQDVLIENLKNVEKKLANKFIMMTTLRGYSFALLWSPLEVIVILSIFYTGVDYPSILPWMILISVFMYVVDAIWGRVYFKKYSYRIEQGQVAISRNKIVIKMVQLLSSLVLFLACVIAIGELFQLDLIFAVTIVIFPFALVWALLMKRLRSFLTIGWNNWKTKTNTMQNFIVLFISLAFFANTLNASPVLDMVKRPILIISDYPILIMVFIQVFFILLSLFGVHPIATMGILGGISGTLMEIINPASLAVVLATSAVATVPVGTYGLVVTITAINTRQSPYYITLYNFGYSLLFGTVGIIVAYMLL